MSKKIAVVVTDRQDEALRMSIGLTLADDQVDVFLLDRELERNSENEMNIETGAELGVSVYSNCESDAYIRQISNSELSEKLLGYDHVLPY